MSYPLLEQIFKLTQDFTECKIENDAAGMDEIRKEIDNLWPEVKKILDNINDDERDWFIQECESFLHIQCGPPSVMDWRIYPKPEPMAWAYFLSLKIEQPTAYTFENFKNGECLEKFRDHPLRVESTQMRYQKMLEAIGYIFNATGESWKMSCDYMTEEEKEEFLNSEMVTMGIPNDIYDDSNDNPYPSQ